MRMRALSDHLTDTIITPTIDVTMISAPMTVAIITIAAVTKQEDGQNHCRWLEHIFTTASQPRAKHNYNKQYQKILDGPCPLHKNTKHKMKDCIGLAREFQDKSLDNDANNGTGGRQPLGNNNNAFQDHAKVVATIFRGLASTESQREWKLAA